MSHYLDNYFIEARLDGAQWTDITGDVLGPVRCSYGIQGNAPTDRIADIGSMTLALNNTVSNTAGLVGYYTPGHVNCRSGFGAGLDVRLRIVHNSVEIIKFQGKVPPQGIQPETGRYAAAKTMITVLDWMEQAANHHLAGMTLLVAATAETGIRGVISNMTAAPPGVPLYYDMASIFPTVFDTARARTTALSEMAKLVHSELGFLYLTARGLVVEGRFTRTNELIGLNFLSRSIADSGALHSQGGVALVTEDNRPLIANQGDLAIFDNSQRDMNVSYGTHLYNSVRYTSYPRRVDSSAVRLFTLQNPIRLNAGMAATISGQYRDPANAASEVSGIGMVTPVSGTHFAMFANADGTGANLTANLQVSVTFGTGDFAASVTNTATMDGFITRFEIFGRGVYIYDSMEYISQDQISISRHGINELFVDMKYQNDPVVASAWSEITLSSYKEPRYTIDTVKLSANRSSFLLGAFVSLEPGSCVHIIEAVSGINNQYFIQGVNFAIQPGGVVDFDWVLREAAIDSFAFWLLGTPGFSNLDSTTRLGL